jgi:transcriptional regulator with XRE-family HTH domain
MGGNPASFGYWVRRRRLALDLTRDSLARRVGCSASAVKKIERDERRIWTTAFATSSTAKLMDTRYSSWSWSMI